MLENVKAMLFDLDGTLIDSVGLWHQIDKEYLQSFGISIPPDLKPKIEGMCFKDTAQYIKNRFSLPVSCEQMIDDWNQMAYEKYRNEIKFKPGVEQFLTEVKKRGIKLGIATSNSSNLLFAVGKSLCFDRFFDIYVTGCDAKKSKPDPEVYLQAAAKLSANTSECLVFEDTVSGIMAGKSAGMKVCGVFDIYSDYATEKKKELADFFINSFEELI